MNEGEQSPENQPLTPTEAAKQYIKDRTREIMYLGISAFSSGGLLIAGVDQIMGGNVRTGIIMALGSVGSALIAVSSGLNLKENVGRLSEESARSKEDRQ